MLGTIGRDISLKTVNKAFCFIQMQRPQPHPALNEQAALTANLGTRDSGSLVPLKGSKSPFISMPYKGSKARPYRRPETGEL